MQLLDPSTLARIRAMPCCWCGRRPVVAHHNTARKGMGGGSRIDHPYNLAPLCRGCHQLHHDGHRPLRMELETLIAAREGVSRQKVRETVLAIRRAVK